MTVCFVDQCITTYNQSVAAQALAQARFEWFLLSMIGVLLVVLLVVLAYIEYADRNTP